MITNNESNPFIPGGQSVPMPGAQDTPMMPGDAPNVNVSFEVDITDGGADFSIPDGDYVITCTDIDQTVSKAGNPMIVWTFAIKDGEHSGKDFKSYTALTPAAMWKVSETVIALGIGAVGQKVKFSRPDVVGRSCIGEFEAEEYNGTIRSSIKSVRPL